MPLTLIVGGFYGDEGKGAVNAYLTVKDRIDAAVLVACLFLAIS